MCVGGSQPCSVREPQIRSKIPRHYNHAIKGFSRMKKHVGIHAAPLQNVPSSTHVHSNAALRQIYLLCYFFVPSNFVLEHKLRRVFKYKAFLRGGSKKESLLVPTRLRLVVFGPFRQLSQAICCYCGTDLKKSANQP